MKKIQTQTGFTIVELLIVIVVIGILAAISVVAYNGVQNRANDSAVQTDLRNLANIIRLDKAETGQLPTFGTEASAGGATNFPGITFAAAKSSYFPDQNNLFVCKSTDPNNQSFAIAARSKSGKVFAYSSAAGGFIQYTAGWPNSITICPALGYGPTSTDFYFSYGKQVTAWNGWIR